VTDPSLQRRLLDALNTFFADNVKARRLLPDGTYERVMNDEPRVRAQAKFYKDAVDAVHLAQQTALQFRPLTRPKE
jgi:polyphosphate kinase